MAAPAAADAQNDAITHLDEVLNMNSIRAIKPYQWNGLWVFDDESVGLEREAFVAGADDFLTLLSAEIPNADKGFVLLFSDRPFPGHMLELDWIEGDVKNEGIASFCGNTYRHKSSGMEGWLCPALFCYFKEAPPKLYAQAKPINACKHVFRDTIHCIKCGWIPPAEFPTSCDAGCLQT